MRKETQDRVLALSDRRTQLLETLPQKPSGLHWCGKHSQIADEIIHSIYADLIQDLDSEPNLSIIATGGYGRSELCPRSDIDITVVPGDESSTNLDSLIRQIFQDVHWAFCTVLRLDVGYAYRLISDVPGLDAKTRTGLLDMRLLSGSASIFRDLEETLLTYFPAGEFVMDKIDEREEMFARYHDTPLVLEPHLKEGAGGLRDFHCASWIGEAIGERAARPTAAYDTVIKFRNLLHYCTGKPQDTLSRPRQSEIAQMLAIDPVQIISEVTRAGQELNSSYRRAKEKLNEARFILTPGVVSAAGEVRILPNCTLGSAATGVAIATRLGLRVSDLPTRAASSLAGPSALFALAKGEKTIRNLDRCTLLDQLLPQLTACRNLGTNDGAHTFTVMEHTLRVIRNLDDIDGPGYLGEIKSSLTDIEPLYLAALLHDVGKLNPDQDHSVEGARIVLEIGAHWELSAEVIDTASWLVREHLTMARFMRIRDLAHPATIDEFAQIAGDVERLKMLTLFTWADVNAVSVGAWTPAQDTFLRQLFERTLLVLQGEVEAVPEASQSRQRLIRQLGKQPELAEKVQEFLDRLPAYYLTSTTADQVRLHMQLAERAKRGEPTIEHYSRPDLGATELTVCVEDSPGLLSRILGVMYAADLSLLGIRACTTRGEDPVAIDVFTISFGGRTVPHATMSKTASLLSEAIVGGIDVDKVLTSKDKDPNLRQHVYEWNFVTGVPGILEIRTPRGRGMPYRFSRLLSQQGWNILSARVGQWAGNGTAAFYLTGADGSELSYTEIARVMEDVLVTPES